MDNLYDKLGLVRDRETFLIFAKALARDRIDRAALKNDPGQWESATIEDYLEAAVAWAEDSREKPDGLPAEPSWNAFAKFLYGGKIYE